MGLHFFMNAAFFVTFREGLEAAMIVGILLATLRVLKQKRAQIHVWFGVLAGIVGSLVFAWAFHLWFGGFSGKSEKIYEGILMFVAGGIIIHLVFWLRQYAQDIRKKLEQKVQLHIQKNDLIALAGLAFLSVAREGIETVIFLNALWVQADGGLSLVSAIMGVVASLVLAFLVFKGLAGLSIKHFFRATTFILVFLSAGLVAHGVVEFQGADIFPTFIKPLYDLSEVMSEKEGGGSILKALFGYDANPSLTAVIAYNVTLFVLLGTFLFEKNEA